MEKQSIVYNGIEIYTDSRWKFYPVSNINSRVVDAEKDVTNNITQNIRYEIKRNEIFYVADIKFDKTIMIKSLNEDDIHFYQQIDEFLKDFILIDTIIANKLDTGHYELGSDIDNIRKELDDIKKKRDRDWKVFRKNIWVNAIKRKRRHY